MAKARILDPARLRRSARRALQAAERSAQEVLEHEDAELRGEESRAARRVRRACTTTSTARSRGTSRCPPSPEPSCARRSSRWCRRVGGHPWAPSSPTRVGTQARDWQHEYGTAFVELLEHLPTDRLNGKVAASVVVTIEHDRLREELGAAHLDTGDDLSASEARRLACSAGVLRPSSTARHSRSDLGRNQTLLHRSPTGGSRDHLRPVRTPRAGPATPGSISTTRTVGRRWSDQPRPRGAPVRHGPPASARPQVRDRRAHRRVRSQDRHLPSTDLRSTSGCLDSVPVR